MATIPLTNSDKVATVDDDDYAELSKWRWSLHQGYARCWQRKNRSVSMHRMIMGYNGNLDIDHLNGDGLDNRRQNIRIVTHAVNLANRPKLNNNNRSGYRGIHWCNTSKRWKARIGVKGTKKYIASTRTLKEAIKAYNTYMKQVS